MTNTDLPRSLLFPDESVLHEETAPPPCFTDLHLDEIVRAVTESRRDYRLASFYYLPLHTHEAVRYRQAVMQDIEQPELLSSVRTFSEQMTTVRRFLALSEKMDFPQHQKGWILEAALLYGEAIGDFSRSLQHVSLRSQGLRIFRDYLTRYVATEHFQALVREAQQVKAALSDIRYVVVLESGKFRVRPYRGEPDYSVEVERVFAKFRRGDTSEYTTHPESTGINHIEAAIVEFVAKLYPEPFVALDRFCNEHVPFVDPAIERFEREAQFYLAYLDFIAPFQQAGLPFCYPEVSDTNKEEHLEDGFDLAVAYIRVRQQKPVVLNSFTLSGVERILVVTGPNQGGKTTFARLVGQVHYLASLGLPIPGRSARLFLPDQIFTHFEHAEDVRNLRGKLEDDLIRLRDMLARATSRSLFIFNEIFSTTTVYDALMLSERVMAHLVALDALAVWVTFLDELSRANEKTVSMVAQVEPDNPAVRTFKIIRQPADGLAYALSLARKHGLTAEQLQRRWQQ